MCVRARVSAMQKMSNNYRLCICANLQQIQTPNLQSAILFIPFLPCTHVYTTRVLILGAIPSTFVCHFFYFICFIFKCAFRVQLHYYYIPFLLLLWFVFLCIYYYCFHTDVNEHVQQQQTALYVPYRSESFKYCNKKS